MERIFLQVTDEWDDPQDALDGSITWCEDKQHEGDVEYIRMDLYAQLEAELTIRQELEELIEDGERYEMGGPFVSVHWVLNRMDALKEGG